MVEKNIMFVAAEKVLGYETDDWEVAVKTVGDYALAHGHQLGSFMYESMAHNIVKDNSLEDVEVVDDEDDVDTNKKEDDGGLVIGGDKAPKTTKAKK